MSPSIGFLFCLLILCLSVNCCLPQEFGLLPSAASSVREDADLVHQQAAIQLRGGCHQVNRPETGVFCLF